MKDFNLKGWLLWKERARILVMVFLYIIFSIILLPFIGFFGLKEEWSSEWKEIKWAWKGYPSLCDRD